MHAVSLILSVNSQLSTEAVTPHSSQHPAGGLSLRVGLYIKILLVDVLVYYCELLGHVWLYIKQLLNCRINTISRKYNRLMNAPRLSRWGWEKRFAYCEVRRCTGRCAEIFSGLRSTKKIAVRVRSSMVHRGHGQLSYLMSYCVW